MTAPALDHQAVLFISFGGPEKSEDVMPFLEIVTKGRGIPRERLLNVAHHYEVIGGRSPINEITRAQAKLLEVQLKQAGHPLPVYVGQRNWHPFLEDTLRKMAADGIKRAIGFATAGHRTEASLERYVGAVEAARQRIGPAAPVIDYVAPWFDHPLFIEALMARVYDATAGQSSLLSPACRWYFTAHSIPCLMAKNSTYVEELRETARRVAAKFGKKEWGLAYSSRSGNPQEPWLEPDVSNAILDEAARGTKEILFIPIGFIADHVEILHDIDIEAQATAKKAGVRLRRCQSVGDHPHFGRMMAEVVIRRMQGPEIPEQRLSETTLYHDGRRQDRVGAQAPQCFCCPDAANPPCCRWFAERSATPTSTP